MAASKARKTAKQAAAESRDVAHKIWLAGIGAYGRAFDEAKDGVENFSENTSELFEDLVKRGTDIEADMRARLSSDARLTGASERVSKVVETAAKLQEKQLERFEERMGRMRKMLGLETAAGDKASKLHAKIDKLEDEIASMRATDKSPAGSKALKDRLARLTAEIDAVAPAKAKPAAKKKTVAKKPAARTAARAKPAAKKPAAKRTAKKKA